MILLISLLILVHELGHFIAAKSVGIRVDKFGFGLPVGPVLFKKKFGETEILIHAFLLGGYVSFPDDEEECDLPKNSPLRFSNKTVGQRSLVIIAGVFFNILFAYFLIFFTGLIWKHLPDNKFTVIFEKFAPSAVESVKNSGIKQGDIIYSINGLKIDYPVAISRFFNMSKEFDGFTDEKIFESKYEQLKKLNPSIPELGIIKNGTLVKLPEFSDEKSVSLTFDNIIGLEKYKSDEIALSDGQREIRNEINYSDKYIVNSNITLKDIAMAISDTKKPVYIVVLREGKEISLPVVYPNKDGLLGIEQSYSENYTETKTLKDLVKATCHYV